MANKKISELVSITGANTASDDEFVIVDSSANETKKITRAELTNALEVGFDQLQSDLSTNGNDILFGDNDKAIFGAGSDLQIYHDGSHSYINEQGVGNLKIIGSDISIEGSGETHATFVDDGAVTLYHNNAIKFATTSSGVSITGDISGILASGTGGDTLISAISGVSNGYQISVDASNNQTYKWHNGGTQSMTLNSSGNLGIGTSSPTGFSGYTSLDINNATNGAIIDLSQGDSMKGRLIATTSSMAIETSSSVPIIFQPTGTEAMRIDSSGNVGIGTAAPATTLEINATSPVIRSTHSSSGDYLQLFHNGSGAYIDFSADPLIIRGASNAERLRIDSSGSVIINNSGGDAQLYLGGNSGSSRMYLARSGLDSLLFNVSNGNLKFGTNNAERMRIDSNGNVGIGHTTPQFGLTMAQGNGDAARIGWEDGSENKRASIICASSSDALQFHTGTSDAERMRIDGSGNFLVASTSATNMWRGFGQDGAHLGSTYCALQYGSNVNVYMSKPSGYSNATYIEFWVSGTGVGSISTNGSSTSYNTSSDYRLKTAVTYDWDATSRLKQLKPARFEWIADGDDAVPVDGFLAHEVQNIVPEAISGTKDAVDENGNPVMQGIDQSKLVPLLCKTILELEARIAALEAN